MKTTSLAALVMAGVMAAGCGDNNGSGGSGGTGGSATGGGGTGGSATGGTDTGGSGGTTALSNEDKALALIGSFESGDPASLAYVSETYKQHNLAFPDGKAVLAGFFTGKPTGFTAKTHRIFSDGDFVFLHNEFGGAWNNGAPQVAFDVFRFEGGLIAEHWDNLIDVTDDKDGTTQSDGPPDVTTPDLTEANRTLIGNAVQDLFVDGKWSKLGSYFDLDKYVQHSPGFGPDSKGLVMVLGSLPEGTPFFSEVKFVHAEGDFVLTMSEGVPDQATGAASAYYDLFRIGGGLIVEHWDVVQAIPPEAEWANANGKW